MMQRRLLKKLSFRPPNGVTQFNQRREMHSRNKKAMELIAKGAAKENFELALDADNSNTHARFWLSKLHLKYHVPGACRAIGAALLIEAANMGDPDAQYELGCKLRVENEYAQSDQQAFHYLEKAVDAVYLTGECAKKDIASALWCLHRASDKGHAGAAIAFGSLVLRGVEIPESVTKLTSKRGSLARTARKNGESLVTDPVEMARERFQIAAKGGCDLGLKWLERLEEEEKQLLTGSEMVEQT
ncbi:hypothetical protein PRUPE_6G277700 [Prunus persica]|uniref:Uncharacterized protein n=1 Tax=Prunus persica TaxID=3760 RepID=A0A251NWR8_PRUPE|nr:hypothetical protein PRUPE_6G277700 [Prunus persica]